MKRIQESMPFECAFGYILLNIQVKCWRSVISYSCLARNSILPLILVMQAFIATKCFIGALMEQSIKKIECAVA